MKKLIAIFCLGLVCLKAIPLYAQESMGVIFGKITDKATHESIPFASVSLLEGNKIVQGAVSDFEGNFKLRNILPGKYTLSCKSVGFKPFNIVGIKVDSFKKARINISLEGVSTTTSEVVVEAYK